MKAVKEFFHLFLLPFRFLGGLFSISKAYVLVTLSVAAINAVQPLASTFLLKLIVDELTGAMLWKRLTLYATALAGLNLLLLLIRAVLKSRQSVLGALFKDDFRKVVGEKIMTMAYASLEDPKVMNLREMALRPILDYGVLDQIFSDILPSLASNCFLLAGSAFLVFSRFPLLAIPIVCLAVVNLVVMNKAREIKGKTYQVVVPVERKLGYYSGITSDFSMGKDIRLFSMKELLMDKIKRLNDEDLKAITRQFGLISRQSGISALLSQLLMCGIYAFVSLSAFWGKLNIGEFTFYTGIFLNFSHALFGIIDKAFDLMYVGQFFEAYLEFEKIPSGENSGKSESARPLSACSIDFRNVTFRYPGTERPVLDGVSFHIEPGEKIALVGRNGMGKTTVIKLLCGFYQPESGEILLDGKPVSSGVLRSIAAVYQDFKLFAFTLYENVVMGPEEKQDIGAVLESVGLKSFVAQLPHQEKTYLYRLFDQNGVNLSGGQEQKLAIARALYRNAPVVFLDEPTAALDPVSEEEIFGQFRTVVEGKTAILISHRLSSTRYCDRILLIDDGRIVEQGSHEELLAPDGGLYRQMFQMQAEYYRENPLKV